MARVTPQEYAEKLARRLSAATQDIQAGVNRVTESPTAAAAAQRDLMRARINEALDSGKWEQSLQRVTVSDWKSAMLSKGVPRIASGIQDARPKLQRVAAQLLPAVDAAAQRVRAMPKTSLEDRINRAVEYMREMSRFRLQ